MSSRVRSLLLAPASSHLRLESDGCFAAPSSVASAGGNGGGGDGGGGDGGARLAITVTAKTTTASPGDANWEGGSAVSSSKTLPFAKASSTYAGSSVLSMSDA